MSRRLYDRRWRVQIGDLDVTALDLRFDVLKSTKREPNVALIRVRNLGPDARARASRAATVSVRAGYRDDGDEPPLLFVGDVRRVTHEYYAATYETIIEARDGGTAYSDRRISRSYAPGTPLTAIVRDVVDAMQIGRGNLADVEPSLRLAGVATVPEGYVATGRASDVLSALLRASRLRWSVQNGALQVLRLGAPVRATAVVLSPQTGLVGSPTAGDRAASQAAVARTASKRRGIIDAVSLLQPGLEPGRPVVLESALVSGDYEVREVRYEGDTASDEWYARLVLRPATVRA